MTDAAEKLMAELKANPVDAAQAVASMVPDNETLRAFLLAIGGPNRRKAYDLMRPYLKFKAKSWLTLNPWRA